MTTTALPVNAERLIDLCFKNNRAIVDYIPNGWNSLTQEEKRATVDAGIARLTAEVEAEKAKALEKQMNAQYTLDQFHAKFAPLVFAGEHRWVNCYRLTECFGGQEEGGWNYTHYTLVACFPISQFAYHTQTSLGDIYKSANTLVDAMGLTADLVMLEALPAQSVTLSRPRYE